MGIWLNFGFKKVTCCLYHSGTVRYSTVNDVDYTHTSYYTNLIVALSMSVSTIASFEESCELFLQHLALFVKI